MALLVDGQTKWSVKRDKEGHREYKITHRVFSSVVEGPNAILNTGGLPVIGSAWSFDGDTDVWAFCSPEKSVKGHQAKDGEVNTVWDVESTFTTRSPERCQDTTIENPLLEPDRVGGSFVNYTKEVTKDRFGAAILSSSHEVFRGPKVEFDHNRATVKIGQNVQNLELALFTEMVNTVNDDFLWGLAPRKVKLSNTSWSRKIIGVCDFYYTREFEFDIDFEDFDRIIYDEGSKALNGHWDKATGLWVLDDIGGGAPDLTDPSHFKRYKDRADENARTLLDGLGEPLTAGTLPVEVFISHYQESNFLLLGIPITL